MADVLDIENSEEFEVDEDGERMLIIIFITKFLVKYMLFCIFKYHETCQSNQK